MAKKKEKAVDLKPTNITDEQLKAIQDIISPINNMQIELGRIESRKHMMLHQVSQLQESLQEEQVALEKEYGKVNINIQTGEINYDVEANS
jgi:allophanate hydrolase subunit 1